MIRAPISFSSWIFLLIAILTILEAFFPSEPLILTTSILIVIFIAVEFRSLQNFHRLSAGVLLTIGIICALFSEDWIHVLLDGFARSRPFLVLFFAVLWLQYPVGRSHALQAVRTAIINQPPGRRFIYLTGGAHFLGSTLNLAGLSLLSTIVEENKSAELRKRLSVALIQGFSSASCWSPFYVGMVVVLVALPSLEWWDLAPKAFLIALLLMSGSWMLDKLTRQHVRESSTAQGSPHFPRVETLQSIYIILSLIAIVMALVEWVGITIPIALALVSPLFALIWLVSERFRPNAVVQRSRDLCVNTLSRLPSLRNETLIFVAANIFGVGIASLLPPDSASQWFNALVPALDVKIIILCFTFIFCGMAGIHPVVIVILISAILPPQAIGVSDKIVGLIYVCTWGLSTMVSPISATTLFMSRAAEVTPHKIGWIWMSPNAILGAGIVSMIIVLLRNTGF